MRFTTTDDSFGFVIERTDTTKFFVFQLVIGGNLLGDREPCILGTAMHQLQNLAVLDDESFRADGKSGWAILHDLQADETSNDATLLPLAESLDDWRLRGFKHKAVVTILAENRQRPTASADMLSVSIAAPEYEDLVSRLRSYWSGG